MWLLNLPFTIYQYFHMGFLSFKHQPVQTEATAFASADREPSWSPELLDLYRQPGIREIAMKLSQRFGSSTEDAEDCYHDAVLILHRHLAAGKYNNKCTLSTYLLSIVKWHSLSRRRRQRSGKILPLHPDQFDLQDEWADAALLKAEKNAVLKDALDHLGERRKNLLKWWEDGLPVEEIAEKAGFKNADVAKKETWLSRKKLKQFVSERPFYRQMLL